MCFLFVARMSSRGHFTSALKHDLTKDCITDFTSVSLQQCPKSVPFLVLLSAEIVYFGGCGVRMDVLLFTFYQLTYHESYMSFKAKTFPPCECVRLTMQIFKYSSLSL